MLFTVAEHHRNSEILHLFGPITQKRDFGQKKCIPVKMFKMGQKTCRNHKKYNFFLYYATYFFALLPKIYHYPKTPPSLKMLRIHPLSDLRGQSFSTRQILKNLTRCRSISSTFSYTLYFIYWSNSNHFPFFTRQIL